MPLLTLVDDGGMANPHRGKNIKCVVAYGLRGDGVDVRLVMSVVPSAVNGTSKIAYGDLLVMTIRCLRSKIHMYPMLWVPVSQH